jgi:hypothetical protein
MEKDLREVSGTGELQGLKNYPVAGTDLERLDVALAYHTPKPDQIPRYTILRQDARILALHVLQFCPPSHERLLALNMIGEVIMHANAAIARNEGEDPKST